jgi:hypothetical protein
MNLASMILMSICWMAAALPAWNTSPSQVPEPNSSRAGTADTERQSSQDTQPAPEIKPSPSESSGQKSAQPTTTPKRTRHKKKKATDCVVASPASQANAPSGTSSSGETTAPGAANTKAASTNCPPPKIVVHQGGAVEPSIQLAGAPGESSQARATATPMLEATETNLKKLEGRQLSDSEKDMVTQIRQYVEQSKTAVAAGDVERARTLAWKAQTLSEDLVKPAK